MSFCSCPALQGAWARVGLLRCAGFPGASGPGAESVRADWSGVCMPQKCMAVRGSDSAAGMTPGKVLSVKATGEERTDSLHYYR
jgi:hypothetical protein